MNIFVLDKDPKIAAHYHCNKHVVKMIVETCQLLTTAYYVSYKLTDKNELSDPKEVAKFKDYFEFPFEPYKVTHLHHPCTKWVCKRINNFDWLCKLGLALCNEYEIRYNKVHACKSMITWMKDNTPELPCGYRTKFALAVPNEFKTMDPIEAYRSYYLKYKKHFAEWPTGQVPFWWRK